MVAGVVAHSHVDGRNLAVYFAHVGAMYVLHGHLLSNEHDRQRRACMGEDDERIDEEREDVAEESTPETDEQATEQRTDDYDGLARRIDDLMEEVRKGFEGVSKRLEALGLASVEETGYMEGDVPDVDDVADAVAEKVDELLGIDALDLL